MTKISRYNIDDKVTGSDKWIGSDSQTQYSTKNFTPTKLATYFNENQIIDIGTPIRYKYDILETGDSRLPGTITFEPQVGTPYSLSNISSFILSKYTLKGNDVTQYLNFLIGSNVLIYKADDINTFGLYKVVSLVENIDEPAFFDVVVTYITGNGSILEDRDYLISLIDIPSGDIPTKTSDLINDGEDGVHPFITAADVTPQVNSDWNATSGVAEILNKPTIPSIDGLATVIYVDQQDALKVDKIAGKGLSTNDFTNTLKTKLDGIQDGAEVNVNADWNATSGDAQILNKPTIPTNTSDLINDGEDGIHPFITIEDVPTPTNGLPIGGTAGQILTKIDSIDYNATWQENYADWTSVVKHTVKNNGLSGTITKGTAVYVTGSNGTNMLVGRASNLSEATSSKTMGLMQTDITTTGTTQTGFVIAEGLLQGLNTAGQTAGDPVWLGVNGTLIYGLINKPYAPAHLVFIGIVTKVSAGNGEIFVKIQNGFELKEIHDVDIITTTPINGHVLGFDGTLWVNKTVAGWLGYTPYNATNPNGYTSNLGTVTSVSALTLGTTGTDLSSTVANGTTTPVITLNVPTASATNRGALSTTDWTAFNGKFTLPSLTSGSILFSNGTTIAQDNTNFFWDDTNNRLGIGTNAPTQKLDILGTSLVATKIKSSTNTGATSYQAFNDINNSYEFGMWGSTRTGFGAISPDNAFLYGSTDLAITTLANIKFGTGGGVVEKMRLNSSGNLLINTTTDNGGKLQIKAAGALSTDIALRVRNSADTDDLMIINGLGNGIINGSGDVLTIKSSSTLRTFTFNPSLATGVYGGEIKHSTGNISFSSNIGTNGADIGIFIGGVSGNRNASALLQVDTTSKGFLPPRMTTTQKNAIATPASGLVVYDTTLGKLCVRGASAWETITSI